MIERYALEILQFPLFQGLTLAGAQALLQSGEVVSLPPGKTLFKEGDESSFVVLTLSGALQVFVQRQQGELVVRESGPGTVLGELGLLCRLPRSASVRALRDSVVLLWQSQRFLQLLEEDSLFADRVLGQSLRNLVEKEHTLMDALSKAQASTQGSGKPGEWIGRYKLVNKLGEGGCGIVYLAEQEEPIKRKLALKVIKLGMDTRQVIRRFEAERQALALMDHPNIAKVLDGGATAAGRPFFVMELVNGIPITNYCDDHRLDVRQRVELLLLICEAIQHAHQKGIIHRDIKPSNILVSDRDGTAVPKVIDFGIAKATTGEILTNKTLYTPFEQFIGTPAYMSPEQAKRTIADVDTRSDIYSLGVLLYELLTGTTPFDAKRLGEVSLDEARRIIVEEEPLTASTRLNALDPAQRTTVAQERQSDPRKLMISLTGDLDSVVMKCLEKERSRRYATVNALATDLRRYLEDEPVLARSSSKLYRFKKLLRRQKVLATAAVAIGVSLILGLGLSAWLYFQERAARQTAKIEAVKSREVTRFLASMIVDMGTAVSNERNPIFLRQILDASVARAQQELKHEPEALADLYSVIGKAYEKLGLYTNSASLEGEAERLRKGAASAIKTDNAQK